MLCEMPVYEITVNRMFIFNFWLSIMNNKVCDTSVKYYKCYFNVMERPSHVKMFEN